MIIGYQLYCRECGNQYSPTTADNGLCWDCVSKNIVFHDDSSSFITAIVQIWTYEWKGWNVFQSDLSSFLYKIEDGWFIWTETLDKEKWEEGIIFRTKSFFDFMEYVIDFTGTRAWETTMISSDISFKNTELT